MKLKFGDLLLAFDIREIEQLREVFLWFGFINDMDSLRDCINEMKLETNQKQIQTELKTLRGQLHNVLRKGGYVLGLFLVKILKFTWKIASSLQQKLQEC